LTHAALSWKKRLEGTTKQFGSSLAPTVTVRISDLSVSVHHIDSSRKQIWNCRQGAFQAPTD